MQQPFCYAPIPLPLKPVMSFMTSPAIINPTTDGTKAVLPGTCLRCVQFLAVPGGQMQC